ncbi:MAG: hypothetical protein HC781_20705 [Leptolyngbyaceae cyanobacterium CSU_1_4]|nr:hypothetical protein [Leptolyngbyaceae cyanobacterium CSU_1_4]
MKANLEEWQVFTYQELSGMLSYLNQVEDPTDIAVALESIAKNLRESFIKPDILITPSNRPEINQLYEN